MPKPLPDIGEFGLNWTGGGLHTEAPKKCGDRRTVRICYTLSLSAARHRTLARAMGVLLPGAVQRQCSLRRDPEIIWLGRPLGALRSHSRSASARLRTTATDRPGQGVVVTAADLTVDPSSGSRADS